MKATYLRKHRLKLLVVIPVLITIFNIHAYGRESVLIGIFSGFDSNIYRITISYMQRKLFNVITVSTKTNIESKDGEIIDVDKLFKDIDINDINYKALVLLNAPERISDDILEVIKRFYFNRKIVAAISTAPVMLAEAGILKGKKATVWPTRAHDLIDAGAMYQTSPLVIDGNVLTAGSYQALPAFLSKLMDMLTEAHVKE